MTNFYFVEKCGKCGKKWRFVVKCGKSYSKEFYFSLENQTNDFYKLVKIRKSGTVTSYGEYFF